jgi:putative thiamine transport system ATP-binding protein
MEAGVDLILERVTISLPGKTLVRVESLTIAAGEIVTLMGPSGCGKSSLLAYIAGDLALPLEGHGDVLVGDALMDGLAPEARRIGRLFQDDLLFPHMTVRQNLLFGIPRGRSASREKKLRAALADAGLEGFEDRAPHTLSGGQRSRIALLRALLAEPRAILLDEPFAKLDADLRQAMRDTVFSHIEERAIPALMVTHDRADAPQGGRIFHIGLDGEAVRA